VIGSGAFSKTAIAEISIPPSVGDLGSWVFLESPNLRRVNVAPASPIFHIGCWAFEGTRLEEFQVPAAVETIEAGAFQNLDTLHTLRFERGSRLVRIASNAFSCTSIGDLELPASLYQFELNVFERCTNLKRFALPADSKLENLGAGAFKDSAVVVVQLPGIRSLGEEIFKGCRKLKVVKFALAEQDKVQQQREIRIPHDLFADQQRVFVTYPTGTLKRERAQLKRTVTDDFV
jgi:hypothetical protein